MIEYVKGDMFATPGIDFIAHGVNLQGVFGAGIAGEIARRYPEVKKDYEIWLNLQRPMLGDILISNEVKPAIAHLATQYYPGASARLFAVKEALHNLRGSLGLLFSTSTIAIPQIGCGIGGLEWTDVKPLIEEAFKNSEHRRILVFEEYIRGQPAEPV